MFLVQSQTNTLEYNLTHQLTVKFLYKVLLASELGINIEIGSREWSGNARKDLFHKIFYYNIGCDIIKKPSVDVVVDAHQLRCSFNRIRYRFYFPFPFY